jgi:GalNAc-alpha-(1->4)-GalNAc-alpha-(1->3)-diNAcBac-PP-undecaprenol alpha-1,4-N-acetyl-D-galactosaminyltransferase
MKITLVIASLNSGGAERVASSMANYWAAKDWEISLLTMCGSARASAFDLHPKIIHRDLGAKPCGHPMPDQLGMTKLLEMLNQCSPAERSVFIPDFNLILALRAAIIETRPDVVLSFIDVTNTRTLLATRGLSLPVIVSEHSDPYHNYLGAGWEGLRRRSYPHAKCLTVLTEEALSYFSDYMKGRALVMANPIPGAACPAGKETTMRRHNGRMLLAMGRLSYEKGFDLLLRAFALIAERQPTWYLQICGEGPLRAELEHYTVALGLAERVRFPGFAKQPFEVMRQADLFVVPSRCEGFSNVLAEAMACGLPVVSFDCPSGPRHIIRDGIDGVLVPPQDVLALAATLDRLMTDEVERQRLAVMAPNVMERFGIEKVMNRWSQVLLGSDGEPGREEQ